VSTISRDEVARLAKLARLALTDDEIDSFAGQLDVILGYVGQIQAVDTSGVTPTGNPLARRAGAQPGEVGREDVGRENVTRPDIVHTSLSQRDALAAAPAADEGRFMVPQILGEGA
jgi:aspartyl-tRNA(Asn)/glutamyl-tRNA(Gln) amidotransferase subunit C